MGLSRLPDEFQALAVLEIKVGGGCRLVAHAGFNELAHLVQRSLPALNQREPVVGEIHAKGRAQVVKLVVELGRVILSPHIGDDALSDELANALADLGMVQLIGPIEDAGVVFTTVKRLPLTLRNRYWSSVSPPALSLRFRARLLSA